MSARIRAIYLIADLTNTYITMSLFKSLTELTKATVQLAKEDKDFRKEAAIAVATSPIWFTKITVDAIDLATGATKNLNTACDKVDKKIACNIYDNVGMSEDDILSDNIKRMEKLAKAWS
jgi:hypothetical protein